MHFKSDCWHWFVFHYLVICRSTFTTCSYFFIKILKSGYRKALQYQFYRHDLRLNFEIRLSSKLQPCQRSYFMQFWLRYRCDFLFVCLSTSFQCNSPPKTTASRPATSQPNRTSRLGHLPPWPPLLLLAGYFHPKEALD